MTSVVPADTDLLCEGCGYIVSSLPESGNCPECGRAIADSAGSHRRLSAFEQSPSLGSYLATALSIGFGPARFFRALASGQKNARATMCFAQAHRFVAATLLAVAICGLIMIDRQLVRWMRSFQRGFWPDEPVIFSMMLPLAALLIYGLMALFAWIAAHVAARIAANRGLRLERRVMARVLAFHSVHWVPVALAIAVAVGGPLSVQVTPLALTFYIAVAAIAVWTAGGRIMRRFLWIPVGLPLLLVMGTTLVWYFDQFDGPRYDPIAVPPADRQIYFYTLTATTLAGIAWLILTAWIAIRNTMFANDRARAA